MKEQTAGKLTEMVIKKTTEELVNVLCTFYKGCAEKGAEEGVEKGIAQAKRFACECGEFEEVHGGA